MEKKKRILISGILSVAAVWGCALALAPVYYANDDAMIQAILSGSFTGTASSMTVYLNQPLSFVLSGFYALLPGVPWFGIFQILCYNICLFFLLNKGLKKIKQQKKQLVYIIFCVFAYMVLTVRQIVLPTYTVTAAAVGASAVYIMLLADCEDNFKKMMYELLPAVVLLTLCYNIRSNVFLMALPFWAAAALRCVLREEDGPPRKHLTRQEYVQYLKKRMDGVYKRICIYFPAAALFLGLVGGCMLVNFLCYQSPDWKDYLDYNDARTTVYDYAGISETEEAKKEYGRAGISEGALEYYKEYNILLAEDQGLDEMKALASIQPDPRLGWRKAFYTYAELSFKNGSTYPYNILAVILYVILLFMMVSRKDPSGLRYLVFLALLRSGIWIWLLDQSRYPERITTGLYFLEFAILFGSLFDLVFLDASPRRGVTVSSMTVLAMVLLVVGISETGRIQADRAEKMEQLSFYENIYSYMEEHSDQFYLLDVNSFANCPEKALGRGTLHYHNYLLLGGWMTYSPLTGEKMMKYGYTNAREAFLAGTGVCFICLEPETRQILKENGEYRIVDKIDCGGESFYVISAGGKEDGTGKEM